MGLLRLTDAKRMAGTLAELSNATLVAITGPGAPDRYGDTPAGPDLWTGEAMGFLEHPDSSVVGQNQSVGSEEANVRRQATTFEVYDLEGAAVVERSGADWAATTVLLDDRRLPTAVRRRFTVTAVEHNADGTLDSVSMRLGAEVKV
jgi:hypothetical protein